MNEITFTELNEKNNNTLIKSEWAQHKNGGGWKRETAYVAENVYFAGVIHGGAIHGGEIHGGEIHGGAIRGGVIRGGVIHGGIWPTAPLQIQGSGHFFNVCDVGKIRIGCIIHTFDEWATNYKKIGNKRCYSPEQIAEYKRYGDLAIEMYGN